MNVVDAFAPFPPHLLLLLLAITIVAAAVSADLTNIQHIWNAIRFGQIHIFLSILV